MKTWAHKLAGGTAGLICYSQSLPTEFAIGIFFGSTAPDWMELPWWRNGQRYSLIPHRTITHWLLLWLLALGYCFQVQMTPAVWFAAGFCLGGVIHVLQDATTRMGVPLLLPVRQQISGTFATFLFACPVIAILVQAHPMLRSDTLSYKLAAHWINGIRSLLTHFA